MKYYFGYSLTVLAIVKTMNLVLIKYFIELCTAIKNIGRSKETSKKWLG